MNVNTHNTKNYENINGRTLGENKPNSNPIPRPQTSPPSKPVVECEKQSVCLTILRGSKDVQILQQHGHAGFRQARILDICKEALSQGVLPCFHRYKRPLYKYPLIQMKHFYYLNFHGGIFWMIFHNIIHIIPPFRYCLIARKVVSVLSRPEHRPSCLRLPCLRSTISGNLCLSHQYQ